MTTICAHCGHDEAIHKITGCEHLTTLKEENWITHPNKHREGTTYKVQQRCMCTKFILSVDPTAARQLGNIPKPIR